jgi:ribosomal protein L29
MAEKKMLSEKEIARKITDLKIELLKNTTKRKSIKREIARLLTMAAHNSVPSEKGTKVPKSSGKNKLKEKLK